MNNYIIYWSEVVLLLLFAVWHGQQSTPSTMYLYTPTLRESRQRHMINLSKYRCCVLLLSPIEKLCVGNWEYSGNRRKNVYDVGSDHNSLGNDNISRLSSVRYRFATEWEHIEDMNFIGWQGDAHRSAFTLATFAANVNCHFSLKKYITKALVKVLRSSGFSDHVAYLMITKAHNNNRKTAPLCGNKIHSFIDTSLESSVEQMKIDPDRLNPSSTNLLHHFASIFDFNFSFSLNEALLLFKRIKDYDKI